MREDYLRAKRLGDREYSRAVAHGEYPYLPALDHILREEGVLSEENAGFMEIPLPLIAGTRTKGRQNAFSRGFMPLFGEATEFATKWQQLYESQLEEGIREPVEVYEFLKRFYVQEGNKRVSVAKYLGAQTILAHVKRILPRRTGDEEIELYYEFLDFFKAVPIYEISFSRQGSFKRLSELMGRGLDMPWPVEEVRELKNSYKYFEELFLSKGGGSLKLTAGDAFLIYMGFYGKEGILEESFEIGKRLDRIWKEILTSAHEHNIELLERPELIGEESSRFKFKGLFSQFFKPAAYNKDKPLNIAFLYEDYPENSGWVYSHELGRQLLQENFGELIKTRAFFGCDTDDAVRMAIDEAVSLESGMAEMVFTTSPSLMPETLKGAIHYPNVHFLNCSLNLSHNAVRTYDTKLYGVKFLLGALSAAISENHRIYYLATSPVFGEVSGINAFAIGAGMVDPRAEIHLFWSCRKDFDWHRSIEESGARVFSGPESHRSGENSREFGIYSLNEKDEAVSLAAFIRNWGRYYTEIVNTVLDHKDYAEWEL